MFNDGLSLEQAPPIWVPIRFFLTAPIFAIIISIIILNGDAVTIMNRYSTTTIAIVHLFTLGVLSMIIIGAMQQMMPVLAGAVIKKPVLFANVVHISLSLGTIFFTIYFLYDNYLSLLLATIFLAVSFLTFFTVSIRLLFKVKFLTPTVIAMRLFTISGLVTVLLGLHLASSYLNTLSSNHYLMVSIHIIFGLFGFALLLIMGVAFQVIPMFYVAKSFPNFIQKRVPLILFILLFIYALFILLNISIDMVKFLLTFMILLFAYYGIHSLNNRKRPIFDVTLLYWKLSLYSLILSMFIWTFSNEDMNFLLTITFALGFLYSLLQGMIYKIIPFLCWFHLTSKGYFTVPTMRELILESNIKVQFYIYISAILSFLLASFLSNIFLYIGAILFIISNLFFFINIYFAMRKYTQIEKTDPMDISAFK